MTSPRSDPSPGLEASLYRPVKRFLADGGYPWAPPLDGGFTVLELSSREEALAWAARIAKACRCDQELRVFGFDPRS